MEANLLPLCIAGSILLAAIILGIIFYRFKLSQSKKQVPKLRSRTSSRGVSNPVYAVTNSNNEVTVGAEGLAQPPPYTPRKSKGHKKQTILSLTLPKYDDVTSQVSKSDPGLYDSITHKENLDGCQSINEPIYHELSLCTVKK